MSASRDLCLAHLAVAPRFPPGRIFEGPAQGAGGFGSRGALPPLGEHRPPRSPQSQPGRALCSSALKPLQLQRQQRRSVRKARSPQAHWLLISWPQALKPCSWGCGLNHGFMRSCRARAFQSRPGAAGAGVVLRSRDQSWKGKALACPWGRIKDIWGGKRSRKKVRKVIRAGLSQTKCWGGFAQQTSVPALCRQGHSWPGPRGGTGEDALHPRAPGGTPESLRSWSLGTSCHAPGSLPL